MRKIISIIFIAVLLFCTGCSTQEEITVPQSSSSSAAVLIEDPDTVKEITLSETDITLAVGDTYQINYSVMPENAGEK